MTNIVTIVIKNSYGIKEQPLIGGKDMDGLEVKGGIGAYKDPAAYVEAYGSARVVLVGASLRSTKPGVSIFMCPLA